MTDGPIQPATPAALWPIDRRWLLTRGSDGPQEVTSRDLKDVTTLALLGPAGSGKTTEARRLAQMERTDGRLVRACRLADYSGSADDLRRQLDRLADRANNGTSIYLDALDEAMVPLRRAWRVIADWIDERVVPVGALVRITCRSAVWPVGLASRFAEDGQGAESSTALLLPLTNEDIVAAAESVGINGARFLAHVRQFRADAFASNPLTLALLLKLSRRGDLPSSLLELFDRGTRKLVEDRYERYELDTTLRLPAAEILEVAELLACAVVLTGRESIDLSGDPPPAHLSQRELEVLNGIGSRSLDRETMAVVGASGLCDSEAPATFRFAHRQLAEYLSGRRLARLLPHQARGLLANPAGETEGVAGPLRETAAFAAIENAGIAEWIAATDPEIVGLSDVADDRLRRTATLGLLDRCRRSELTDEQVGRGEIVLDGLRYGGAETDLRPVLQERSPGSDDVLECAIELIETWKLSAMSEDLADLMIDQTAPLHARSSAGYALVRIGTDEARTRTKPLIAGDTDDEFAELKGLALRCNWPTHLTTSELLAALTDRPKPNFYGAYDGFLWELERSGFNAEGSTVAGLRWAKSHLGPMGDSDPLHRIAIRVVHHAIGQLDEPGVLAELLSIMQRCASAHIESPFGALSRAGSARSDEETELPAVLEAHEGARRRLIEALVSDTCPERELWRIAMRTPYLRTLNEFPWLLEQADDDARPLEERKRLLYIARSLPWQSDPACVEAWLNVRRTELVHRELDCPLSIDLASVEASKLREEWKIMQEMGSPQEAVLLDPPPQERILRVLELAEAQQPRLFFNLCRELTLEPANSRYRFERFLVRSPGWASASKPVRQRVVEAAKCFLMSETEAPAMCRDAPLESILPGGMAAFWLLLDVEPTWLENRSREWWLLWCWYILREMHPRLHGEPQEQKFSALAMLHRFAPDAMRAEVIRLASADNVGATSLLSSLLELLEPIRDADLDRDLGRRLTDELLQPGCIGPVAEFLLRRDPGPARAACTSRLTPTHPVANEAPSVQVAIALLNEQIVESWGEVMRFVEANPDHGRLVLALFAHEGRLGRREGVASSPLAQLDPSQLGQLVGLLFEFFPPESDPEDEGFRSVGPDDSARHLRNQLISALGNREDRASVDALLLLERHFGSQYPWLRRPRARAERAWRLTQWLPLPLDVIKDLLQSTAHRLVRSEVDVQNGTREAIESYGRRLRLDGGDSIEDLWDKPAGQPPSPKAEEHVSRKVCDAIRSYFEKLAIAADREVQIHRRAVPPAAGGEPGSELDVLVQVPARGTLRGSQIRIPIEVKLSHNREVRTAMRAQLADRYMPQLGTMHGVYVVAWMNAPAGSGLASAHQPRWTSIEEARADLERQSAELAESQGVKIVPIVIDVSLR